MEEIRKGVIYIPVLGTFYFKLALFFSGIFPKNHLRISKSLSVM